VTTALTDRRPDAVIDADDIGADLRQDRPVQRRLDGMWPNQTAAGVVRALLRRPAVRAEAADGILTEDEQHLLAPRAKAAAGDPEWAETDLPLLDEAQALLSGPPRRYGYVVVDEAQDLTGMALRMVARRSADGRSFTILGDLAQATAPGSTRDWAQAIDALGQPEGACIEALSIGYRVPGQIMDLANRLMAAGGSGLPITKSVRVTDDQPTFRLAPLGQLAAEAVDETSAVRARFPSVAVIAPAGILGEVEAGLRRRDIPLTPRGQPPAAGTVTLLHPAQAKGLEFDAVVVVDPADFVDQPAGRGLLYIALTRAVQHVSVVYAGELPSALVISA
jgi:DNA helicase IV